MRDYASICVCMHVGDISYGEYGHWLVYMREYALGGVNMEGSVRICAW